MLTQYKSYSKALTCIFSIKKYFSINFNFVGNPSQEQLQFKEQIAKFVNEKISPIAAQIDEKVDFPHHLWKEMGNLGILGVTVPPKYGGSGLDYTTHCLIMEEISRGSGSVGLSYSVHSNVCINQFVKNANEAQKAKYLPKLCSGEWVGALAMTEPNAGSDVVSMKTTAIKHGNKYFLNGTKMFITNGPNADIIIVFAKTDPKNTGPGKGMTAFIVEKNFKGFTVAQKLNKMGMRGSNTGELVFENCEIPEENVLGEVGKGVYLLMNGLDIERLVLGAGPIGIMQASFDLAMSYVTQRKELRKKIGDFQMMQGEIADMYKLLQSSKGYLYSLARLADLGHFHNIDGASVILLTSSNAVKLANQCMQLFGENGNLTNYPAERFLRDSKLYTIGAGTNEIRRWLIGRELMKAYSK